MKKLLQKAAVLTLVFVLGVAGTALLMNRGNSGDRLEMERASLPEVMMEIDGVTANRMTGYRQKMQVDFTRECITPISTDRTLKAVILPYEASVKSLSYEIRTSDGSKVLENQKIKNLTKENGRLTASFSLQSAMRMSREYSMQLSLETGSGEIHYYTRVVQRPRLNAGQYLNFARSFYEKALDKAQAEDLGVYLEPDTNAQSGSYTNLNLHASLEQVSWGKLAPTIRERAVPVIKEINETTGSVELFYQISAQNEQGTTEYYDVREFYRMRYMENRIRLLDFAREAQQVFDGEHVQLDKESLLLGVADRNVQYRTNEDGSVVAFVQQGDLWSYNKAADKITRIFSFRQEKDGDFRSLRNDHKIKIMNVTEQGDVEFVLYGYMNRGVREGMVGLCVYRYSNEQNAVEEKVFIPSKESFEFFDKDLEILSYINRNSQLFLLQNETLYQVDIAEGSYQVLQERLLRDWFVVSESNAHAAWIDGEDPYAASSLTEIDFETLATRTLKAADGQYVRPLGFLNEDLVYGVTRQENVVENAEGQKTFAIDTVKIQEFDGKVVKEFHRDKMYVTKTTIGLTLMELELSAWEGGAYVPKTTENIVNNKKAGKNIVEPSLQTTERQGVRVRLTFSQSAEPKEPLTAYAKLRSQEERREISMNVKSFEGDRYFVYAKGRLQAICSNPKDAVLAADAQSGVVLNRSQQYIWERGNRREKVNLNLADIPEVFLSGTGELKKLEEGLGKNGRLMDLSGCTLDQILYNVGMQRPVIAKKADNAYCVIVGYDGYNTWLYHPEKQAVEPFGMQDSTALFASMGNVFITYMENYQN